jgi:hypothetical protein
MSKLTELIDKFIYNTLFREENINSYDSFINISIKYIIFLLFHMFLLGKVHF